jgi:hypothetical protein
MGHRGERGFAAVKHMLFCHCYADVQPQGAQLHARELRHGTAEFRNIRDESKE